MLQNVQNWEFLVIKFIAWREWVQINAKYFLVVILVSFFPGDKDDDAN